MWHNIEVFPSTKNFTFNSKRKRTKQFLFSLLTSNWKEEVQREKGEILLGQPSDWDRNGHEGEVTRKPVRQSVSADNSSCVHEAFHFCKEILDLL